VPGDVDANALSGTCPCSVYVDGHSHGDADVDVRDYSKISSGLTFATTSQSQ
jgi:hypothetical protein